MGKSGVSTISCRLLTLPTEILTQICQHAALSTLLPLRLTHSLLASASNPFLFRSITLVPHACSFANCLLIAQSPHLSRHVHSLIYDLRMLSSIPDIKMAFEANEFALLSVNSSIDASRAKVWSLLDDYQRQAFTSLDDTEIEINYLLKILPSLPSLTHVSITTGIPSFDRRFFLPLPTFTTRLKASLCIESNYYFETSPKSGNHARNLLLCLAALNIPINGLAFTGISTQQLITCNELRSPARYLNILQRIFRTLPRDQLPLPIFLFLYNTNATDSGVAAEDLHLVVASVLNVVQDLSLCLATQRSEGQLFLPSGFGLPPMTEEAALSHVAGCMFDEQFGDDGTARRTRRLALGQAVLTARDLKKVLGGEWCLKNLEELTMGDIRLYSPDEIVDGVSSRPEACWVDVLERIAGRMSRLRSARLFGRLYNGGSQDWWVSWGPVRPGSETNQRSLKMDVQRWLVSGGVCPLEKERVGENVKMKERTGGDQSFLIYRHGEEGGEPAGGGFVPTTENELLEFAA